MRKRKNESNWKGSRKCSDMSSLRNLKSNKNEPSEKAVFYLNFLRFWTVFRWALSANYGMIALTCEARPTSHQK